MKIFLATHGYEISPCSQLSMLGSVIYRRVILIKIIREDYMGVWKINLAPVEIVVDKERTENLNRHRTTAVIILDPGWPFYYPSVQ